MAMYPKYMFSALMGRGDGQIVYVKCIVWLIEQAFAVKHDTGKRVYLFVMAKNDLLSPQ